MSEDTGLTRRRFLAVATGVTGAVGAGFVAVPAIDDLDDLFDLNCVVLRIDAGLLAVASDGSYGPDQRVLFIHTGGAPSLYHYQTLPSDLGE